MELWISVALFSVTGLLMVVLAIPLLRRRVKPNALYGLRVRATFESEAVWYEANAHSAKDLLVLGLLLTALALLLPLLWPGISLGLHAGLLSGLAAVGAVVTAIRGTAHANRLLREASPPSAPEEGAESGEA